VIAIGIPKRHIRRVVLNEPIYAFFVLNRIAPLSAAMRHDVPERLQIAKFAPHWVCFYID
jgi:hypothetical protein